MNLIFVITKNEIRPFRSNDGKTVSKFHISGEEIYEYDECYDFAEDMKEKLLAILNMRDFSEVTVDIAYIKGEKRAAEEILREIIPCLRVQVGEFEKIEDYTETAEQMLCITDNKSVALGMELDIYRERFARVEKRLVDAEKHIAEIEEKFYEAKKKNDSEYQALQKKYNELEINVCDAKYAHERFCCYFDFVYYNDSGTINIDWNLSNGEVFSLEAGTEINEKYFTLGTCSSPNAKHDGKFIEGFCPVSTSYQDDNYRFCCNGDYKTLKFSYKRISKISHWNAYSCDEYIKERKLIILKSNDIAKREIFAVITHPDDSEEAVREWVKTKEGK